MADPTSVINLDATHFVDGRVESVIKSAEALVVGGIAALDITTGKAEFMDDADNLIPLGAIIGAADGDNESHLTGDSGGNYSVVTRGGIVVKSVTVTGASAITDKFKWVYMTDGQTYTLTKPTTGLPVGFVERWRSSTTCDVYLLSPIEALIVSNLVLQETIYLGFIPTNALQGTSAIDIITARPIKRRMQIDSFWAACGAHDNAVIAGSQILNLEINTTDVTGGALTLAFGSADGAADMGVAINATAITAANVANCGDTLSVEMAASGTAFTSDCAAGFHLYIDVTYLPGA